MRFIGSGSNLVSESQSGNQVSLILGELSITAPSLEPAIKNRRFRIGRVIVEYYIGDRLFPISETLFFVDTIKMHVVDASDYFGFQAKSSKPDLTFANENLEADDVPGIGKRGPHETEPIRCLVGCGGVR